MLGENFLQLAKNFKTDVAREICSILDEYNFWEMFL